MRGVVRLCAIFVALLSACGFKHGDTPQPDTGSGSGSASAARQQMEVVAGAGRVKAGTITLDVQVGRAVNINQTTAGTITISGQPVVKP